MKRDSLTKQIKYITSKNEFVEKIYSSNNSCDIEVYYYKGICNIDFFNEHYFTKINYQNFNSLSFKFPGIFKILDDISIDNLNYQLTKGNIIVNINDLNYYFVELSTLSSIKSESSHIDPINMFESKSDFTDLAIDNIALITKRLKNEDIVIKHFIIGEKSKTDCYILCLKKFIYEDYTKEIIEKIENAKGDYYLGINDLNTIFNQKSFVPLTFLSSSPSTTCSNLINGKVVIILDNTPIVTILPTTLSNFTSVKNEINTLSYYSFFSKSFIIIFLILSIFSLGFFISIINFHSSFFSPIFIANLQLTERGTSFPIIVEILIILFLYDFYRFTTSRSPQSYIQNIVIFFGSLVIGQNAIQSGMVGSLVMMLTSIAYLSSFAVTTNPYLISSMNIARIFILIFSYLLGLFGFIFSSLLVILYLRSQKSFGKNFLDPFTPINFKNIYNFFFPRRNKKGENI